MGQPVVHFEIAGKDGPALQSFYSQLFEWEIDTNNPMGYGVVTREGTPRRTGGASAAASRRGRRATPGTSPSTWRCRTWRRRWPRRKASGRRA